MRVVQSLTQGSEGAKREKSLGGPCRISAQRSRSVTLTAAAPVPQALNILLKRCCPISANGTLGLPCSSLPSSNRAWPRAVPALLGARNSTLPLSARQHHDLDDTAPPPPPPPPPAPQQNQMSSWCGGGALAGLAKLPMSAQISASAAQRFRLP